MGKLQVLLVEDEHLVAMLTEDTLVALGYDVVTIAAILAEGMAAAAEGQFDLALLDINLRGFQSFPIADMLASRNIPFVFVTGYGAQAMVPRYAQAALLQKPYGVPAVNFRH